jgi:hypothetical protein
MSTGLFSYPDKAKFGRVLPKSKIYAHAKPGKAVKEHFVQQVEQIVWEYKLAPETVNLKATPEVPEIQIFRLKLKAGEIHPSVLQCIDQAIPFPILFELVYNGRIKPVAAYKRPSDADSGKWVAGGYYWGEWMPEETALESLPLLFSLDKLYQHLLLPLMSFPIREGEGFREFVQRMYDVRAKEDSIRKTEAKLRKEKQFNRKVVINSTLRDLKQELDALSHSEETISL